jgi:hypothetical protein
VNAQRFNVSNPEQIVPEQIVPVDSNCLEKTAMLDVTCCTKVHNIWVAGQICAAHAHSRSAHNVSKRAAISCVGGLLLLRASPALADLPGFKKDLRNPRSRNKVDPELFEDGEDGLRC